MKNRRHIAYVAFWVWADINQRATAVRFRPINAAPIVRGPSKR